MYEHISKSTILQQFSLIDWPSLEKIFNVQYDLEQLIKGINVFLREFIEELESLNLLYIFIYACVNVCD